MMYALIRPFLPIAFAAAALVGSYFAGQQIERLKNKQAQELRIATEQATAREALRGMEHQTNSIGLNYDRANQQTASNTADALTRWQADSDSLSPVGSGLRPADPQGGERSNRATSTQCSNYAAATSRLFDAHGADALRLAGEAQSLADRLTAAQSYIADVCLRR